MRRLAAALLHEVADQDIEPPAAFDGLLTAGRAYTRSALIRTGTPDSYQAILRLKPGSIIRYQDRSGSKASVQLKRFEPKTGKITVRDNAGRSRTQRFEDFLQDVGSPEFLAGERRRLDLSMPARSYAGFQMLVKALEKRGISVVWKKEDDEDGRLKDIEKEMGRLVGAYYDPRFNGTYNGLWGSRIILARDATLGAFLAEIEVASVWEGYKLVLPGAWETMMELQRSDDRPPAYYPNDRFIYGDSGLVAIRKAWDNAYVQARLGNGRAAIQDARKKIAEMIPSLRLNIDKLAASDPHRPILSAALAGVENWRRRIEKVPVAGLRLAGRHARELPSSPLRDAAFWKDYDDEYQVRTRADLEAVKDVYLRAKKEGDPHIAFLERMGFQFELAIRVPPLSQVFERYNRMIDEKIAQGRVSADGALRPARVFRAKDGRFLYRSYGEPLPQGALPYNRVLDDKSFGGMINAGYYPVGESTYNIAPKGISTLEHDLGHLGAFDEHPRFAAAFKKLYSGAGRAAASAGFSSQRLYYLVEMLSVVSAGKRQELLKTLRLPKTLESWPTTAQVDSYLAALPETSVNALIKRLEQAYPKLITHLGGTVRDVVSRESLVKDPNGTGYDFSLDYQWRSLTRLSLSAGEKRDRLARLIVFLVGSTQVDPVKLVEEAANPSLWKDSSLRRFWCQSGAMAGERTYYKVCSD